MTNDISSSASEPKLHSFSVEWKIENFLSLKDGHSHCSPKISCLLGRELRLHLLKWDQERGSRVCLNLMKNCIWIQTMTISARVRKKDGTLEELEDSRCTSTQDKSGHFFFLQTLGRVSEVLPSDTLTLYLFVEGNKSQQKEASEGPQKKAASKGPQQKEASKGPQKLIELEILSANFGDLLIHQKKCDVTLKVQKEEFRAHKAVLVARSPVFAATFEGDTIEERTGVVTIPDCDPDSFRVFLHYLYTGKAEDISCETGRQLYTTADKYDVPELKSFCVVSMRRKLSAENLCDVVSLADLHEDSGLLSSAQGFFNGNFKDVFATTGWVTLQKTNLRLANKLLKEMAASVSEITFKDVEV